MLKLYIYIFNFSFEKSNKFMFFAITKNHFFLALYIEIKMNSVMY